MHEIKDGRKLIVFNPDTTQWLEIGRKAVVLWDFIKSKKVLTWDDLYFSDFKINKSIINILINKFIQKRFLHPFPYGNFSKLFEFKIRDLHILLTDLCNLRCKHCIYSSGKKLMNELDLDEIKDVFVDFKLMGGENVILSVENRC